MTLLADVVTASQEVTDTSSRSRKVAVLAELLRRLDPGEVPVVVGFLAGAPRRGGVGVGYSTIYGARKRAGGSGVRSRSRSSIARSATSRRRRAAARLRGAGRFSRELLDRATEPEAEFVRRLFTGELRQGALAGLMVDAVAKAAGVPGELARRALMLSGDLTRTAEIALAEGEEGLRGVGFELFRPVLPMLASTAESVGDAVRASSARRSSGSSTGSASRSTGGGDEVRIYTRNLNDITDALPGIVDAVRRLPVDRRCSTARRCGWARTARPRSRTPSRGSTARLRPRGWSHSSSTCCTSTARTCSTAARGACRAARGDRAAAPDPARSSRRARRRRARARRRRCDAGPRRRRRQGCRLAVRRRATRQGVAQGQAGADVRPRRARRRVGSRPPAGMALEPAPRRPRPGHRRVRDGGQDASRA